MKNKLALFVLGILILGFIYKGWFLNPQIIGGDWPYFYSEQLLDFNYFPFFWQTSFALGSQIQSYSLDSYLYIIVTLFVNKLHISWEIVYKVFYFLAFPIISFFSISYLVKTSLGKVKNLQLLISYIIFTTNTYILMILSGGQMGVGIAYALLPFILGKFISLVNSKIKFSDSIITGLILEAVIIFEPRIAFIAILSVACFLLINFIKNKPSLLELLNIVIIPAATVVLLSLFWIVPLVFSTNQTHQSAISSSLSLFKFFSFADFPHSISLLHPNWPENIFGKVYFLFAEFLILPIIAFSSILFFKKNNKVNKNLTLLCLLGLIGAFLAKGSNDPFGQINIWIYNFLPGFSLFRDPTKFYILIAVSYSILIPFTILSLIDKFSNSKKLKLDLVIPFAFLIFWVIIIRQAFFGQIGGTFVSHSVPQEYIKVKEFLYDQKQFFRTLWVPRQQRFTFFSNNHPSIEARSLFNIDDPKKLVDELKKPDSQEYLSEISVKYVVVPYDSMGEFFLKDRKYDPNQGKEIIDSLSNSSWLKEIKGFGQLGVFENQTYKDHFWTLSTDLQIDYKYINPVSYEIRVKNAKKGDILIFSENYDKAWSALGNGYIINSQPYKNLLNSFTLIKSGDYDLQVKYTTQKYANIGWVMSIVSFLGILIIIFKSNK